jgi:hypothetical protein
LLKTYHFSEKALVKRYPLAFVAAIAVVGMGASSVSASQPNLQGNTANLQPVRIAQATMMPPADFGAPPSGEVPILFNDHHVYSKPDRLKQNRVLAALVRGNEILVPLRSMFEQMGATVSYNPATQTADVSKPGSDVKVTVGKPEVTINGESRPLDVPPEIYKGSIVVPVRVISEGMGAYVQWVPEKKVVVVRYVAAPVPTPPPTAPPTAPPTPKPAPPPPPPPAPVVTPSPTPAPPSRVYEHFIVGDYVFKPTVYNQFSNGTNTSTWGPSYSGRAAIEFPLAGMPVMLEGYAEQYAYTHPGGFGVAQNTNCNTAGLAGNPACVTPIGNGGGSFWAQQFQAVNGDAGARLGVQVANPRIYIAGAYLVGTNNYGYPRTHGFGFGVEKLPDLDKSLSVFGSAYYFPEVQGGFTAADGTGFNVQYRFLQYQAGLAYNIPFNLMKNTGLFIEGGFMGNSTINKQFLPGNGHQAGAFAGIGIHF